MSIVTLDLHTLVLNLLSPILRTSSLILRAAGLCNMSQPDKWERERMEKEVRKKLEYEFGVPLPERSLAVVDGVQHKFDLASEDGSIIGEIKTSGENVTTFQPTRLRAIWGDLSRDCLLLLARTGAQKRILALTNAYIYAEFRKSQQGRAAKALGIVIRHIPA